MKLSDAKVLVTGGTSGIGYETAKQLKEDGATVAVCARTREDLERTERELGVLAIQADVSNPDDVESTIQKVVDEFGGFNVLVNNAAYGYFEKLPEIDLEKFNQVVSVNLTGAMLMGRAAARHFIQNDYGNIINISSTAGLKGFAGGTPYVATKFALKGMTQCWAQELRKNNIRVFLVNPSEVQTNFATSAGYEQKKSERKLYPEDIAHAIISNLKLEDRGFIPELTVWATNPD